MQKPIDVALDARDANSIAERAGGLVERHGSRILQVARRFSRTATDADDAYQLALEKLLTKAPCEDEHRLLAWTLTVARNEALMIRRRNRTRDAEPLDELERADQSSVSDPGELVIEHEQFDHGREALRGMHPDQVRCLLLRADGYAYPEICELTGFSYPKVNRCLTDGRRNFSLKTRAIEVGHECTRFLPALSMLADGELSYSGRHEVRAHLKHCGSCRSTLRQYRAAPRRVAGFFPVGFTLLASVREVFARAGDVANGVAANVADRFGIGLTGFTNGAEVAAGKKLALVTLVSASLVAGGAGVHEAVTDDRAAGESDRAADFGAVLPTGATDVGETGATSNGSELGREPRPPKPREATADDIADPARVGVDPTDDDAEPPSQGRSLGADSEPAPPPGSDGQSDPGSSADQPADLAP